VLAHPGDPLIAKFGSALYLANNDQPREQYIATGCAVVEAKTETAFGRVVTAAPMMTSALMN
jgi:hypothetical protein